MIEETNCCYESCPFIYWLRILGQNLGDWNIISLNCPCRETYKYGDEEIINCKIQGAKDNRIL